MYEDADGKKYIVPPPKIRRPLIGEADLTAPQKHVLRVIVEHLNFESGTAWPSQETIARFTGYTTRTVQRAINDLEALGVLTVDHSKGRLTSSYEVEWEWLEALGRNRDTVSPQGNPRHRANGDTDDGNGDTDDNGQRPTVTLATSNGDTVSPHLEKKREEEKKKNNDAATDVAGVLSSDEIHRNETRQRSDTAKPEDAARAFNELADRLALRSAARR